jgi:hypothetical protein
MASETQFYLQFPDADAAQRIGAGLREDGFDVQVGPSPYGGDGWAAVARIAVEDADLEATETRLKELAESAGGGFDGYDKLLR